MLRNGLILALALGAAALSTATASDAIAQPKKAAPKGIDAAKIGKELESGDEARALAALEQVAAAGEGGKPAAPHIDKLLVRGASTSIAVKALEVCGGLKQQKSSTAIAPYVKHRNGDVRRGATKALVKTRGPAAIKALRGGLRSSDAQVRGISATGLGAMGAKEALPDLFNALDHRVAEAAASIGQLCTPTDCEKFASRLGKLQLDVMTSGFDQILFRPPAEMPDDQKIKIIGKLRELGTKDVGAYLADVSERWPENWSKKVKQAIDSAVKASGGGSSKAEP
jgi:HEAT repeat protein